MAMTDTADPAGKDAAPRINLRPTVLKILEKGIEMNFPPAGFDPISASLEELMQYHLPPRPDPARTPRALANWLRVMSQPLSFPDNKLQIAQLFNASPLRSRYPRSGISGGTSTVTQESSQNWSGGYVRPRDFSRMALVEARWTVPTPLPSGPGAGTYASSAWVGLDGHDPASRSLPQIGTGHWVTVTSSGVVQPDLFAWWEWWGRDDPHNQQIRITQIPVQAGDWVYGRIQALSPTRVNLFIKNETTGASFTASYTVQPPPPTGPNPLPPHVEGRTADWILERPAPPDQSTTFFALANYGRTTFRHCNAATETGAGLQELHLRRARLIRMNVWDDTAQIGHLVSIPRRKGGDALRLRFV
jgi:hypothetical protein